ncbi:MAG: glycosyltransferase, partial [Bacteroidales bacterium]|nr:glycosyltransferase [Bacteroidales bacterium]
KSLYYLPISMILTSIFNKKTMVIHHHFMYLEFSGLKRCLYKFSESLFLKTSKYILTPSPYIKDLIKAKIKKEAILCPIPFTHHKETAIHNTKMGNLLYVGTIEERKGLKYIIQALKILKQEHIPAELKIVGKIANHKYYADLQLEISKHDLNVNFFGYVSTTQLEELYSNADAFVFPSLLEGFGMAINEAMTYGLPVIAFNNSAMPYSVNENNGILVDNKDYHGLASAIKKLILNRELRNELSKGAAEYSRTLTTHDKFHDNAINILNTL